MVVFKVEIRISSSTLIGSSSQGRNLPYSIKIKIKPQLSKNRQKQSNFPWNSYFSWLSSKRMLNIPETVYMCMLHGKTKQNKIIIF